ncbi:MAG: DUF928 domain-containing protein [Xenococcaceae cyanobacterium MO_207.B15]|nr:DUF928 domain-containing protein [Xenococcaceae cyanobacterium MO_207.B15]
MKKVAVFGSPGGGKSTLSKTYQWFLALMCQGILKPDSPVVQGSVKRVSTTITSSEQFQTMKRLEKAQMYEKRGYLV